MKRLGVYAFIGLTLIGVVGGLIVPKKALAQTADPLLSQGISIFDNELATIQSQQNINPSTVNRLIQSINDIKNVFVNEYNSATTIPEERYKQAILKASIYTTTTETPIFCDGPVSNENACTIIRAFATVLGKTANPTQTGEAFIPKPVIDVLSPDTLESAKTKLAAANVITAPDTDQCSFFDGNILGCIDQIVTWLIKVTLLQLAGFLVWLSSNMLNLAIQVGILNFSQWAPDALYPVWVIIRQIVSLFVVFAGLYLGFMYIIGREDAFEKYIPWIIVFALFVNFSYPLTRTLVDVSNVISLNIYASTMGGDIIAGGDSKHTAGAIIMDRLGLQGLAASATAVDGDGKGGFVNGINSTPGALVAVAFVFYAAYIFFKATWIIVSRTALLVFLTVGSPVLFVDSIVPALGERAAKLRTLYFKQLVVAPVFMIMLALTLKFLDVFQTSGALGANSDSLNALASASSIQTFFSILMMLIMLHITITVTENIAGSAGNYAGSLMGKVGGFGLGLATGGTGLLARGTLGMAAARIRDSKVMDTWQGTRTGRGLYSLTNSMATSTYDARNVGAVSKGMSSAGMGMGKGLTKGYDERFKEKEGIIKSKYGSIKDASAREGYLAQKTESITSKAQRGGLGIIGLSEPNRKSDAELIRENIEKEEDKIIKRYNAMRPDKQKEFYLDQPETIRRKIDQASYGEKAPTSAETPKPVVPSGATEMSFAKLPETATKEETPQAETTPSSWVGQNTNAPAYQRKSQYETENKPVDTPVENKMAQSAPLFNLHTEDFAAKIAEKRAEKQKIASQEANKEMKPINPAMSTPLSVPNSPSVEQTAKQIADEAIQKAKNVEGGVSTSTVTTNTPYPLSPLGGATAI
ncbi:MAG: hypothetical protein WCT07_01370 [Candidatus Paceibacterota bacterium]|jgi:hypothetical protein